MSTPTNIQEQIWFDKPYVYPEVAEDVDLHVRVTGEQTVTYQFVSTGEDPSDPPFETTLQYGYDDFNDADDWFFTVTLGNKFFMSQFQPA